ncbi:MAG: NYN domain-containing protein [Minisyncoccales bacterium]
MKLNFAVQRIAIFIDIANLYHSAKNLYQARVNFNELISEIIQKRNLVRALAYGIKSKTGEERNFFTALKKLGIELRLKDLQEYHSGFKKGNWDVGMTIDVIKIANSVDTIVLVTGDGDFLPLLEYLQYQGKRVEVVALGSTCSTKLKWAADSFFDIEKKSHKFLFPIKK